MNIPTMIVLVVFLFFFGTLAILQQVIKMQRANKQKETDSVLASDIKALESRIEILERIVTDRKTQLKDKIDTL